MLARWTERSAARSNEPVALDVAALEKPKQAPRVIGNPAKRKSKKGEEQMGGEVTINKRSGKLVRFWSTLFACFGVKASPDHDRHRARRTRISSMRRAFSGRKARRLKEIVEDTSSSGPTIATGASLTTRSGKMVQQRQERTTCFV